MYVFVYAKQANQTKRVTRMCVCLCERAVWAVWVLVDVVKGENENISQLNLIVNYTKSSVSTRWKAIVEHIRFFDLPYLWRHPFTKRNENIFGRLFKLLFIWLLLLYLVVHTTSLLVYNDIYARTDFTYSYSLRRLEDIWQFSIPQISFCKCEFRDSNDKCVIAEGKTKY